MVLHQYIDKNNVNPGDLIIQAGIQNIPGIQDDDILAGTPWFGPGSSNSPKMKWLENLIKEKPNIKAIGIGSVVSKGKYLDELMETNDIERIKSIWGKIKHIEVRDHLTSAFLQALGIAHELKPCPSIYALDHTDLPDPIPNSVLVVGAKSWHHERWPDSPKIEGAHYVDYTNGRWTIKQALTQLQYFGLFETIISQRIHAVIPLANHRKCYISPVDSRYEAATLVGIPIYNKTTKL